MRVPTEQGNRITQKILADAAGEYFNHIGIASHRELTNVLDFRYFLLGRDQLRHPGWRRGWWRWWAVVSLSLLLLSFLPPCRVGQGRWHWHRLLVARDQLTKLGHDRLHLS